jgi:branched-subunit amino acid permease
MEKKNDKKRSVVAFKMIQAIFLGIMALGLSMMGGDVSSAMKLPFSSFSLTTTVFGIIGAIITEIFSRKAEKW